MDHAFNSGICVRIFPDDERRFPNRHSRGLDYRGRWREYVLYHHVSVLIDYKHALLFLHCRVNQTSSAINAADDTLHRQRPYDVTVSVQARDTSFRSNEKFPVIRSGTDWGHVPQERVIVTATYSLSLKKDTCDIY